jgi:hypothetical protein
MDRNDARRRLLVALAEAVITLAVVWLTNPERPALQPMIWYRTMRGAETVARWANRAGRAAQRRYREAIDQ